MTAIQAYGNCVTQLLTWASLKRRYRGGLTLVAELCIDERAFELAFTPARLTVTEGRAARPDVRVAGSLVNVRAWLFQGADARALVQAGKLRVEGADEAFGALLSAFAEREPSSEEVAARLASREL